MTDHLDWRGYDFSALPVCTRGTYWADADLRGANSPVRDWTNAYARGANFARASLVGSDFCSAYLGAANFTHADLTGVCFELAALTRAKFHGAKLPHISAFTQAFVGKGDPEAIAKKSGLPLDYVLHAQATSLPIVEGCEAAGTQSPYHIMDEGADDPMTEALDA